MAATSVPRLLRSCRLRIGRTEEAVAGIAGVSVRTVKRWETGRTRPSTALASALRLAYGLTVSESAELGRLLGRACSRR